MRIDKYLTGLLILAALGSSLISGSVSAKEYFTVKITCSNARRDFASGYT